ncbi:hypothetical protein V8C35DRAFT_280582 [Trichoderma chlorosporum]
MEPITGSGSNLTLQNPQILRDHLVAIAKEAGVIILSANPTRQGPNSAPNLKVFTTLLRTASDGGRFVNSLRCSGSAAIATCRVAAGQQDAFWELRLLGLGRCRRLVRPG